MKTLDQKLARIRAGQYRPTDFIIANAKDGDIGLGCTAAGVEADGRQKPRAAHLQGIRDITRSGFVDIMLMSASGCERLSNEGLFIDSPVTPAIRLNDETDTWSARGGRYKEEPSRAFRTARIAHARKYVDLGLYSVTFSNQRDIEVDNAVAYGEFREEATANRMRHFLEVFNPAFDVRLADGADIGSFINDNIVRTLAGVMSEDFPAFLKLQFNGPRAMEELAAWDPGHLIVGILGGAQGTTRDTFELLSQAEKYGARVALFGRKIDFAESPIDIVELMRRVTDRDIDTQEAVKAYHGALQRKNIRPAHALEDDVVITDPALKQAA